MRKKYEKNTKKYNLYFKCKAPITVRFFLPIMTFFYANNDIYNDTNNDINNDICNLWSIMIFECHYWIFCDQ